MNTITQNMEESLCFNKDEIYVCPNCNTFFYDFPTFNDHIKDQCSSSKENACSILYKNGNMPSECQRKIILTVDEFFYGEYNPEKKRYKGQKTMKRFTCQNCDKVLRNNLRFISHVRHKVESEWKENDNINDFNICNHCYRYFDSPFHLQCHLETVHTSVPSPTSCRICDLNFSSDEQFLEHMKRNHKNNEMPYICKECSYRTSFYQDFVKHFRAVHENENLLFCLFCLAIHRTANSHLGHVVQHLKKSKRCTKCRLQFISNDARILHVAEDHNSVLIPTKKLPSYLDKYTIFIKVGNVCLPRKVRSTGEYNKDLTPVLNSRFFSKKILRRPSNIVVIVGPDEIGLIHSCWECGFVMTFASQIQEHFKSEYQCPHCIHKTHCNNTFRDHALKFHAQTNEKRMPELNSVIGQRSLTPSSNGLKRTYSEIAEPKVELEIAKTIRAMNSGDHQGKRQVIKDMTVYDKDDDYIPDSEDEKEFSMLATPKTKIHLRKKSRSILPLSLRDPFLTDSPVENMEERKSLQSRILPCSNSVQTDKLVVKPFVFPMSGKKQAFSVNNDGNVNSSCLQAIRSGQDDVPTVIELQTKTSLSRFKSGSYPLDFVTNNLTKFIQKINPIDILNPPTKMWFTDVTSSRMNVNWLPPEAGHVTEYQLVFCGHGLPTTQFLPAGQESVCLIALTSNTLYRVHLCCFRQDKRSVFICSDQMTLPRRDKKNMRPVDDIIIIDDDPPQNVDTLSTKRTENRMTLYNQKMADNTLTGTEVVPAHHSNIQTLNPNFTKSKLQATRSWDMSNEDNRPSVEPAVTKRTNGVCDIIIHTHHYLTE